MKIGKSCKKRIMKKVYYSITNSVDESVTYSVNEPIYRLAISLVENSVYDSINREINI
jgi:hypothetical protein